MRILTSLTTARELFVRDFLMQNPEATFEAVNQELASETHKDLWHAPKVGEPRPLMMAFKRIAELRDAAKTANEALGNGQPLPPIPPSSLKRVKELKAELVADAPANDNTIVVTVDHTNGEDIVTPVTSTTEASEAVEVACQAV